MKQQTTIRRLLFGAALFTAQPLLAAVPITSVASPDTFPAIPAVADWSTLSVGSATDGAITTPAQFDAKIIAAADIAGITTPLGSSGTFPPSNNLIARWNSGANTGGVTFLQTRPTTNDYVLLAATLDNTTGTPVNALRVAYKYSKAVVTGSETIKGLRVFWSRTGAPGSWTLIPGLSKDTTGTYDAPETLSVDVNLGTSLPAGGTMYLLWADQNSNGTDASYHIDDFAVTKSLVPILTPTVTNVQRQPGANPVDVSDDTFSFDISVAVFNPPAGTPGWITSGAMPPTPVTGAYNSNITLIGIPVSAIPFSVTIHDQLDANGTAVLNMTDAMLPPYAAISMISGSPVYLAPGAGSAAQWALNRRDLQFVQNNGGGTVPFDAATESLTFSAGTPKYVTLTLEVEDVSTGSNFEIEDRVKVELVTDAGTQILTGTMDKNGSGFINGYSDLPAPDAYDTVPLRDEFNRGARLIADTFTNTWRLQGIVPPSATSASLVVSGVNNSGTEFFRVRNILFGIAADSDGDGAYDTEEAVAGTDPNNPASKFRILTQGVAGLNYNLEVPTVSSRLYQLDVSSDLLNWVPQAPASAGIDGPAIFTTPDDNTRKFLRVTVQ